MTAGVFTGKLGLDPRNEIISNLKYAINLHHGPLDDKNLNKGDETLLKLLDANSGVHVAEIEKVMNRTIDTPDEFLFLVILKDKEENEVARLALEASGLYFGGMTISKKRLPRSLKNRTEALEDFSIFLNTHEVKKIERILGLRVNEWVILYLLEHTGEDFQPEIFLVA